MKTLLKLIIQKRGSMMLLESICIINYIEFGKYRKYHIRMHAFINQIAKDATKNVFLNTTTRYQRPTPNQNQSNGKTNPLSNSPNQPTYQKVQTPVKEQPQNIYNGNKYSRTPNPKSAQTTAQNQKVEESPSQKYPSRTVGTKPRTPVQEPEEKVEQPKPTHGRNKYGREPLHKDSVEQSEQKEDSAHKSHFARKPAHKHELHHLHSPKESQKSHPSQSMYTKSNSNQQSGKETTPNDTKADQPVQIVGATNQQKKPNNYSVANKNLTTEQNQDLSVNMAKSPNNRLATEGAQKSNLSVERNRSQSTLVPNRLATETSQTPQKEQQQTHQKPKVRSNLICYAISKYFHGLINHGLSQVRQVSKVNIAKSNIFAKILSRSAAQVSLTYQKNLKAELFRRAKLIGIKANKDLSKSVATGLQVISQNEKNYVFNLLEIKFKSQLRLALQKLKNIKQKQTFISKGLGVLSFIERRKARSAFETFKENTKNRALIRQARLKAIVPIVRCLEGRKKREAFQKLLKNSLPSLKPSKTKVKSKKSGVSDGSRSISSHPSQAQLIPISHQTKSPGKDSPSKGPHVVYQPNQKSVDALRDSIGEKKDSFETEKRGLQELLSDLRALVNDNVKQVEVLTKENQKLKQALDKLSSTHDMDENDNLSDSTQGYLPKLVEIFVDNYSSKGHDHQDEISTRTLIDRYELEMDLLKKDETLKGWALLRENSELKRQVEQIQGLHRQRKTAAILEEEHRVIQTLVRSYIRERYLWEWVRNSIKMA